MDSSGNQLRVIEFTDYTAEAVRSLFRDVEELRDRWASPSHREEVAERLAERGIDFDHLADVTGNTDADAFDLLCHLAFDAPLRTRRERAERLRKNKQDLFDEYGPDAKAILNDLLDKYAEHGLGQFKLPDALRVPPISTRGNVKEIIAVFGGADQLRTAVESLQRELYAA